ncbi:MAG: hypothetical protein WA873_02105 [Jannaschia helgolandensis]|jgi:hypothetical protein|nr:hypothetical protein [Jannaschia helgolandensis]
MPGELAVLDAEDVEAGGRCGADVFIPGVDSDEVVICDDADAISVFSVM